jgi:hypothetical protein
MKQDAVSQKFEAPAKEIIKIKFGLDVHANQITVCRQIGDRTPQPSLKMNSEQAFKFIKDSGGPGIELHSCYEAESFGYHLHRALEEMGVANIVVTPERVDPRCMRVKTDKRDARTLVMRLDSYTKPRDLNEPERLRVFRRDLARTDQHIPGYRLLDEENLARKATLTSSGDLRLSALAPDGPLIHLEHSWAQLLPLHAARVSVITCLLDVSEPTTLEVALRTGHRPDNFTPEHTLATRRIELSAGLAQEVTIEFETEFAQATYAFVFFAANPAVRIRTSEEQITGLLTVRRKSDQKAPEGIGVDSFEQWSPVRRPAGQNLALRFSPALEGFGSENVINGIPRPNDATNAWVAAPSDGNAWLELKWPSPQNIGRVEITFDAD